MLTERRSRILLLIIRESVDSAVPVGSETLVRKYGLRVSPATIRHEMVSLEDEGYLMQPHTSAGRIPSDRGYRYYVESLMEEEELPDEFQRTVRHQFYQVSGSLEEWARLAAGIISRWAGNLALVTAPHAPRARLRWLELVEMRPGFVLLVAVLRDGRVHQQTVPIAADLAQEELTAIAQRLSGLLTGLSAAQAQRKAAELTSFEEELRQAVVRILEAQDTASSAPAYLEGLRTMLSQPEFAQPATMLGFLELLDEQSLPRLIPFHQAARGDVSVIIGQENPQDVMRQCTLVVARYGRPMGVAGTLGVLGPTRLSYDRAFDRPLYAVAAERAAISVLRLGGPLADHERRRESGRRRAGRGQGGGRGSRARDAGGPAREGAGRGAALPRQLAARRGRLQQLQATRGAGTRRGPSPG
jgi:heat-inducible transcriptional repressor